jgi:hypothetical protein
MYACDPECFKAFERLLAQPDPPEMPRRAHVYSCDGELERRATRLPAILMGWLQRRHLDVDVEEPLRTSSLGARTGRDLSPTAVLRCGERP